MLEEYISQVNDAYYDYCNSVKEFSKETPSKKEMLQRYHTYLDEMICEMGDDDKQTFNNLKYFKNAFAKNSKFVEENVDDILENCGSVELQLLANDIADKKEIVFDSIKDAWNYCYCKTSRILNREF